MSLELHQREVAAPAQSRAQSLLKANDKDEISPGIRIPARTPPIFLAHSSEGKISDPAHSVVMNLALQRAGIPAELHVYATGDHDFGVRQNEKLPASWMRLCIR